MILIDSDIFVIDLLYPRDARFVINRSFLEAMQEETSATTVFNLLEVCGITSFGYSKSTLEQLYSNFPHRYGLRILTPPTDDLPAATFLASLSRSPLTPSRQERQEKQL